MMNAKIRLMTTAVSLAQRVQSMPNQMERFMLEVNLVNIVYWQCITEEVCLGLISKVM